ncbi:MAG: hypothetical protein ACI4VM_01045 [Anaerovoracaceae bacterium]
MNDEVKTPETDNSFQTPQKAGILSRMTPLTAGILILSLLVLTLGAAAVWQTLRLNKVYSYVSERMGDDLSSWQATGVLAGNHPLYDDSAVVKAYKNGSDGSELSEKDAYVLKTASGVIDEIITEGMSDYEKELAVYNWLFAHTHFNEGSLAPIAVEQLEDEAGGDSSGTGVQDSQKENESMEHQDEAMKEAAEDDPICQADPYRENLDYEPYGVLKYGNYICVGNATTMQLFMDLLDIPCMIIHSTREGEHAWNLVQIGGDWYHLDLTFDNGGKSPAYANFNVPDDVKLDSGYPWDTTEYPAADALTYNYAVQNCLEVTDIYELPAAVRKTIDSNLGSLTVTFAGNPDLSPDALDSILQDMAVYYSDSYFYTEKLNLDTGKNMYRLQLQIYDNPDEEEGGEGLDSIDYDYEQMQQAIDRAFGDRAAG